MVFHYLILLMTEHTTQNIVILLIIFCIFWIVLNSLTSLDTLMLNLSNFQMYVRAYTSHFCFLFVLVCPKKIITLSCLMIGMTLFEEQQHCP